MFMKCHFLEFFAGVLVRYVIACLEIKVLIVLISFLLKKFHVVTLFFMLHGFFYSFLSCQPQLEGAVIGEEPLLVLSCASHFILDIVAYFKQSGKGQQFCCCLFFLCTSLHSSFSSKIYKGITNSNILSSICKAVCMHYSNPSSISLSLCSSFFLFIKLSCFFQFSTTSYSFLFFL